MNDYGEIIKLPYKVEDIYELLKKLLKYDKIRHISLKTVDDENKNFDVVFKTILKKAKVNIKLTELEKGVTELSIYAETNRPIDFNGNRKVVKKLVNIIFKGLEECTKTSNDDFSVSIIKKKNGFKSFLNFIAIAFLAFLVFYFIFLSIDSVASRSGGNAENKWVFIVVAIFFGLVYSILYKIVRIIKRRRYSKNRVTKIKKMLYHLIEEKAVKKNINSNSGSNEVIKKIGIIPTKVKPYIDKGINYIKKTKKEKPKIFWTVTISLGALVTWGIVGTFTSPTHIEGVFVQQRDGYTGNFVPVEITFKDGLAYGSGATSGYLDGKYEYKIRGNKIYVIVNGQEVFSELTIKNKNTLIYGDGVVDRACDPYQYGGVTMECYNNGDGIYIKQ